MTGAAGTTPAWSQFGESDDYLGVNANVHAFEWARLTHCSGRLSAVDHPAPPFSLEGVA